jgi:predicted transcriptional regulator
MAVKKTKGGASKPDPINYEKLLDFYGVATEENGGQLIGDCPFCGKEKHFFLSQATGLWDCKVCGLAGNVYAFLSCLHQHSVEQMNNGLYARLSKSRKGLPAEVFKKEQVGFFQGKFLLPVWNPDGALANLHVWDGTPGHPVISGPGLSLHLIHAPHIGLLDPSYPIYVVEGFWDTYSLAHMIHESKHPACVIGVPGANVFKSWWANLMVNRNVVFMFDNDSAGENGMARNCSAVQGIARNIGFLQWPADRYPEGYDMNDYFSDHTWNPNPSLKALLSNCRTYSPPSKSGLVKSSPSPAPRPAYGPSPGSDPSQGNEPATIPMAALTSDSMRPPISAELMEKAILRFGKPKRGSNEPVIPTFENLIKVLRENYYLDQNMVDAYAVMYATVLSIKIPGDPLWTFLVGPPSSGKTLAIMTTTYYEGMVYQSTLTPATLVSGYKTEDGSDPSILRFLSGKTLGIKDYTAVKSLPIGMQEQLYGVMRDAYDGRVDRDYGNQISRHFDNSFFSLVAGVTHVIHGDNRASLGERFIKFEFIRANTPDGLYNPRAQIEKALEDMDPENDSIIKIMTAHFLEHHANAKDWSDFKNVPTMPEWVKQRILALAEIVAYLRCGENPDYRPQPEIGARLAKQMKKLGQALCIVMGKTAIDRDVYRIIEQCAYDTSIGWNSDIMRTLLQANRPLSLADLMLMSSVSKSTLERKMNDLLEIRAVHRLKAPPDAPGRPAFLFQPAPYIRELYERTMLPDGHPASGSKPRISKPSPKGKPSIKASANGQPKPKPKSKAKPKSPKTEAKGKPRSPGTKTPTGKTKKPPRKGS